MNQGLTSSEMLNKPSHRRTPVSSSLILLDSGFRRNDDVVLDQSIPGENFRDYRVAKDHFYGCPNVGQRTYAPDIEGDDCRTDFRSSGEQNCSTLHRNLDCSDVKGIAMKKQAGFTLIELVVVIVILGILAAIALPKFVAVQADARLAKMSGAMGAVKSAAAQAHAILLTRGFSSSFTGTPVPAITVEGTGVVYTNGYPNAATIVPLAGLVVPDYTIAGLTAPRIAAADAAHTGAAGPPVLPDCTISYTASAAADTLPTFAIAATLATCS